MADKITHQNFKKTNQSDWSRSYQNMPLLHPVPLESPLFCASKPQLLCALRLTVSTCNCLHGLALGSCSSFACWCRKSEVPSSLHCPHLLPGKIQQPVIFSVVESQFSSLVWGQHKLEVKCTLQSSCRIEH